MQQLNMTLRLISPPVQQCLKYTATCTHRHNFGKHHYPVSLLSCKYLHCENHVTSNSSRRAQSLCKNPVIDSTSKKTFKYCNFVSKCKLLSDKTFIRLITSCMDCEFENTSLRYSPVVSQPQFCSVQLTEHIKDYRNTLTVLLCTSALLNYSHLQTVSSNPISIFNKHYDQSLNKYRMPYQVRSIHTRCGMPYQVRSIHTTTPKHWDKTHLLPIKHNLGVRLKSGAPKMDLSALPELDEEELEEDFVRGSGPGGQSVNKTANCVRLTHLPTGITVKNHETRSLDENRKRARLQLQHRLDFHLNGDNSIAERYKRENSRKKLAKKKKTNEKLAKLKAFKEREDAR